MANEALVYPVYKPATRIITSITNANPAVVTTGLITYPGGVTTITPFVHSYASGMIIRLMVPYYFGMREADETFGEIVVISTTSFFIDIDTTMFDAFIIPSVILVPDPFSIPPGGTKSLPPIIKCSNGTYALEEFAQAVPFAEDNNMLTSAVQNVLPY
jgi:hypothetical protein